jgi:hypothetical protein
VGQTIVSCALPWLRSNRLKFGTLLRAWDAAHQFVTFLKQVEAS